MVTTTAAGSSACAHTVVNTMLVAGTRLPLTVVNASLVVTTTSRAILTEAANTRAFAKQLLQQHSPGYYSCGSSTQDRTHNQHGDAGQYPPLQLGQDSRNAGNTPQYLTILPAQ